MRDGEAMHSDIGPETEARAVYLEPSRLGERLARPTSDPVVVWDVGLGIAANAIAALECRRARPLRIESFEHRLDGLRLALEYPDRFPWVARHEAAIRALLTRGSWFAPGVEWCLREGDFLAGDWPTAPADVVFYDFYAPPTDPRLWGYEVFSRLRPRLREGGVLCTYSCSTAVRSALMLAGFRVGRGAGTARKRETTVASPSAKALTEPLGRGWIEKLRRSHRPLPADWPEARANEAWEILNG